MTSSQSGGTYGLSFREVSKTYGGSRLRPALENFSLEVTPGEIVGMVGLNGAGKTTALRIAAGLTSASSGKVFVRGHDVALEKVRASSQLGFVPEYPYFESDVGSLKLLQYFAGYHDIHGNPAIQQCRDLLVKVGLEGQETARLRTFSQGMKKRFSLAAALIGSPAVLLLDEIVNGLDPEGVYFVRQLLLDLRREKKAILLSSHVLSELQDTADRFAIVHRGRLVKLFSRDALRKVGPLPLRITLSNFDQQAVDLISSYGRVSVEENRIWVHDLKVDPGELSAALGKSNYRIIDLRIEEPSLEHVFLELVREKDSNPKKEVK